MRLRRFFLFFAVFITLFPLSAKDYFSQSDIKEIMDQLFEYHIDKREMNTSLLERSFKLYLEQFDAAKTYLLQEEVQNYYHPSPALLGDALKEYNSHQMNTFVVLNSLIQKSIFRAREWRREWEARPQELIALAKNFELKSLTEKKKYAGSIQELKQRQKQRLLAILSIHIKDFGVPIHGKEHGLIALCEKQLSMMENEYLAVDDEGKPLSAKEKQHQVVLSSLKAMAGSLDTHTAFYSPDEALAMKVQLEKGMCGIGVVLRESIEGITIHEIIKDGPAEKSGLIKIGDTIVEVDGTSIKGISFHHSLELMRGKEGSKTVLGILRSENKGPQFSRVELVRSKIVLGDKRVDISSEPYGDGIIGKITLHSFYEGENGISSETDVKKSIESLREQGPLHGLVLDMRENSGGFLSQAVKVSGLFISSGIVVVSRYADGSSKYYRVVDSSRFYDGPLVVLISRGSASATEIVAQVLKDYGVAVIAGDEQTYGKGTIQHQTVTNSKNQALFKVTVGMYYSVSGKSPQLEGVKSDIFIPSEYNYEKIGEGYLDYPLPADFIAPVYADPLSDVDNFTKKWFKKHYLPTLQKKEEKWELLMPVLQSNSQKRIEQNRNYQLFLSEVKKEVRSAVKSDFGQNDLQMDEAVNVLKDMIFLSDPDAFGA